MELTSIRIVNFRNFEDITIALSNKNIFFGLNDVGKTNFMYALRYVFDREVRKNSFTDSDFHCKNIEEAIEILIAIDISDTACVDNQKLRAGIRGGLLSSHDIAYIKLHADYNSNEALAAPVLYWGGDADNLYEMKQKGVFYEIDHIFNTIYIDAYVDLYKLFKKNASSLLKNKSEDDEAILWEIEGIVDELNNKIASLSGIKAFEQDIEPEYKKFRNDDISISIKSELAVTGLYSNVIPYIKHKDDHNLYPTSGEGRKKILAYSIYDLLAKDIEERKINLFLIEEPENHLHKSMQIALSKVLFSDESYKYLFITTHSPYILYEMDGVNLVRIYNQTKVDSISSLYSVPEAYQAIKRKLNKDLSEAIFSDKVLLVEGESEVLLFSKILTYINPFFEADGIYILSVDGIGFDSYFRVLDELKITNIVKTDNDLRFNKSDRKYSVLGFSRCNSYIDKDTKLKLPTTRITDNSVLAKRKLYDDNKDVLDKIRDKYKIYLSRCDLENDLDEVLHKQLVSYIGASDAVGYLQDKKKYHMVSLIENLTDDDCKKIYNHYNFACLRRAIECD